MDERLPLPEGTEVYKHTRIANILMDATEGLGEVLDDYEYASTLGYGLHGPLRALHDEMLTILESLELPSAANDPERRTLDISPPGV